MRLELLLIKLMLKTPSMYPSSSPFFEIFDFTLEISAASAAAADFFVEAASIKASEKSYSIRFLLLACLEWNLTS